MPITRRSRRGLHPVAREVAKLHNDASRLAGRLRVMAGKVDQLEEFIRTAAEKFPWDLADAYKEDK